MNSLGAWLSPLLLLPGAAMLIISTAARFAEIHAEVHRLLDDRSGARGERATHLLQRSLLFRNALVALYSSVSLFALGGLLGGLTSRWEELSITLVMILSCLGILALLTAATFLIREAILSMGIVRHHLDVIDREDR